MRTNRQREKKDEDRKENTRQRGIRADTRKGTYNAPVDRSSGRSIVERVICVEGVWVCLGLCDTPIVSQQEKEGAESGRRKTHCFCPPIACIIRYHHHRHPRQLDPNPDGAPRVY